jgi:hypothetical protein
MYESEAGSGSVHDGEMQTLTNLKRKDSHAASRLCERCASPSLKRQIAIDPVDLTGRLTGRRVDVYRVELDQCRQCGHLTLSPEGQAKVKRCVKVGKKIFLKSLD